MTSQITADSLSHLRLPQSFTEFGGVPAIDVRGIDPTEQFTARTDALPAAGTYCAAMAPLASNPTAGVFVYLWDDGWKFAEITPQIRHATAPDNLQGEFSLWTLKRRLFSASAAQGKADALYGLRGRYGGVFSVTAGAALLPAADPLRTLLTGQVAFCDTIVHSGGGEFLDGPHIIGGQGNNARSSVVIDAENSIGVVLVGRVLSPGASLGFEIGGL